MKKEYVKISKKIINIFMIIILIAISLLSVRRENIIISKGLVEERNALSEEKVGTFQKVVVYDYDCGLAIDMQGRLFSWGKDYIGDGVSYNSNGALVPIQIMIGKTFKEISERSAIDTDGNLWQWGYGANYGSSEYVLKPIQIAEGVKFKKVSRFNSTTLAIDENDNLWGWGYNGYGQLGDGTTTDSNTPIQIKSGTKFKEVVAGTHSMAIDSSGNLWTWGKNNEGQLGDGTETNSSIPLLIMAGTKFNKIANRNEQSMAIDINNRLFVWGYYFLGDGTYSGSTTPKQIMTGTTFSEIAMGNEVRPYSLAIDMSGNLWNWGYNGTHESGTLEGKDEIVTPEKIMIGKNLKTISTTGEISAAIDNNNKLYIWGPKGEDYNYTLLPTKIKEGIQFKEIATGEQHSMAIDYSGNLYTWGNNDYGQLGNGTTINTNNPTIIKSGTKFTKIAAGESWSLAIDSSGYLWAWGYNKSGQLGDGTQNTIYTPKKVQTDKKFKDVSTVSGYWSQDYGHTLAIDENNNLWAWGYNGYGQLGDGTKTNSLTAIQIKSGTKFNKVYAGMDSSFAIDTSGNLWAWGDNDNGQLGNGTETDSLTPIQIKSGTKFSSIESNEGHTIAIDTSKNLWSWGNQYVGDGSSSDAFSPVQIKSGTKFNYASAGYLTRAVIDGSGNLYTWGQNHASGTLGTDYINTVYTEPYAIMSGTLFSKVCAGIKHAMAIDLDGNLYTWGTNMEGQLGNGEELFYCPKETSGLETYLITYELNGGNLNDKYQESWGASYMYYTSGNPRTLLSSNYIEKGELEFGGWYDNKELTGNSISKVVAGESGNKTFYAKWIGDEHTVTFKDGTETVKTEKVNNGASATAPELTKEGYTLSWDKDFSNITSDLTVNAVWTANTYNVILNKNGGTINSGNVSNYTYGIGAILPTDITKTDYSFGGWYASSDFSGNAITNITASETGDKEYYAKWIANKYKVTFKNGTQTVKTEEVNKGASATAPELTKEGYKLSWDKSFSNVTSDLTVNAVWTANTYSVILNRNGGTINSGDVSSYTYGIGATLPTDVTREAYTFAGWYVQTDFSGEPVTNITTTDVGDKTYHAKWEKNKYTVIFKNAGNIEREYEVEHGTAAEAPTLLKEGYTLSWDKDFSNITSDLTVNAVWTANTYNVILNRNGGTINSGNVSNYTYGIGATLPTDVTREAYTFAGWYVQTDFTGEAVTNITTTDVGDKTYHAKWEKNKYTVIFKNEGNIEREYEVEHGTAAEAPTLIKEGYTLSWDKDFSNITSDLTINAVWIENTNTAYKVEHYKQNTSLNGYDLVDTENKTGTTSAQVTATAKEYTGFTENTSHSGRKASGNVLEDGSLVLKLYYDRNSYNVILNRNGGTINSGDVSTYTYGIGATLPTDVTREAYTFAGWYVQTDFTGEAVTNITTTDVGDKTYHAKWEKNKYTVIFKNEGNIEREYEVEHGTAAEAPTLIKEGYSLSWDKDFSNVTSDLTINAVWTANTNTAYKVEHYKQNISLNGYDLVDTENKTGTTSAQVTATAKEYTGFTENTSHSGRKASGDVLQDGSLVLKLYYDRNSYNVVLNTNGGTVNSGNVTSYTYGIGVSLPTDVTKDNCIFTGWYDNKDLTGNTVAVIEPGEIEDKAYYAKWTEKEQYYIRAEKCSINMEEKVVTKVSPDTKVDTFINGIETNGSIKVLNLDGQEARSEELVGTGYKIQVDFKGTIYEYEIAVRGDLDGNGKVTVTDLSTLNKIIVKTLTITGIREKAADIDYSDKVSVVDLSMMNQAIVGTLKL